MDRDGEILYEILSSIQHLSLENETRSFLIESISRKHLYPSSFMNAFFDLFLPEANPANPDALPHDIERLISAAIAGSNSDCGMCMSVLGFFISTGLPVNSFEELEPALNRLSATSGYDFIDIEDLLHGSAATLGSTLGILSHYNYEALSGGADGEVCAMYSDSLGNLAAESASADVANSLVGTSVIDLDSNRKPLHFLTPESLEADEERLEYLVSTMKENAEYIRSSIFLDPVDVLEFMGFEEPYTDEELLRSVEGISHASTRDIASEIVQAIRTATYNTHATKYNEGIKLLTNTTSCLRGLQIFHRIVSSQNLFVKVIFYFLKMNIFANSDWPRARLAALLLSHMGILPGVMNAIAIIEKVEHLTFPVPQDSGCILLLQPKGLTCSNPGIDKPSLTSVEQCIQGCRGHPHCDGLTFDPSTRHCIEFHDCQLGPEEGQSLILYRKICLSAQSPCWSSTDSGIDCLFSLRAIAGLTGNHTESINWIIRQSMGLESFDTARLWSQRSSEVGSYEGKYYLASLERMSWVGHPPNESAAESLFWELVNVGERHENSSTDFDTDWTSLDQLEHETVREVAFQLGIPFDEFPNSLVDHQSIWPAKVAGVVGLFTTYIRLYRFTFVQVMTAVAVVPVLFVLLRRRIF